MSVSIGVRSREPEGSLFPFPRTEATDLSPRSGCALHLRTSPSRPGIRGGVVQSIQSVPSTEPSRLSIAGLKSTSPPLPAKQERPWSAQANRWRRRVGKRWRH